MSSSIPTRVSRELHETARLASEVTSRSVTQQIEHWARIGREVELASSTSHREVAAVLAGLGAYDDLSVEEQSLVRARWNERIEQRLGSVDLVAEFAEQGATYVEMDDDGRIVRRAPDGQVLEVIDPDEGSAEVPAAG